MLSVKKSGKQTPRGRAKDHSRWTREVQSLIVANEVRLSSGRVCESDIPM
jgi:hypothetical protein